jgi:hypothetical protein
MVVDPLINLPVYRRVFQKLHLSTTEYLEALRPPITGSLLMTGTLLLLKPLLPPSWPLGVRFGIQVVSGGIVYVGALMIFHGGRLRALYVRLRAVRARKGDDPSGQEDPVTPSDLLPRN